MLSQKASSVASVFELQSVKGVGNTHNKKAVDKIAGNG